MGEGVAVLVLSLPFLGVGAAALRAGFLSHEHAHLVEKALLVRDRGRLEWIGFAYPPLPVLLLLPWPAPEAAVLWAGLLGGLLAWGVWRRLEVLSFPRGVRALMLLAAMATPTNLFLASQRLGMMLSLVLFFWAWRWYLAFTREGRTDAGFLAALIIGFAFYASFYAPAFALAFALATPLFTRPRSLWHGMALGLVLLFPAAMTVGAWLYLAWLFTGQPLGFLYDPGSSLLIAFRPDEAFGTPGAMARELAARLVGSPLYLGVGVLIARYQPRRLPAYGIPLGLTMAAWSLGWAFPRELGVALWTLFALSGLPARTPRRLWPLVLALALLHIPMDARMARRGEVARWWAVVFDGQEAALERVERSLAEGLARRPCGSVLADDRSAYRIIAQARTACPFVLPADPVFELALSQPAAFVDAVLVAEGAEGWIGPLEARYRRRPPRGFGLAALWPGWRLYQRLP